MNLDTSERFPTKRQRGLFIMVYLATSSLTWIITVLRMYGNSKEIDWCVYVKSIFLSKVPVAPNWLPGWILAFAIWRCVSDRSFQHFWAENEHFSYRWKWVMGLILCPERDVIFILNCMFTFYLDNRECYFKFMNFHAAIHHCILVEAFCFFKRPIESER